MLLQYHLIDEAADVSRKSNVILAAFTTAHARCILYSYLEKVRRPENILYCDTDSIMYFTSCPDGEEPTPDIPTGSNMGDMTNELPKDVTIFDYFSGGPKFYLISGWDQSTGKEYNIFKIKGLTLNRATEKSISKDAFKKLILAEILVIKSPFQYMKRSVSSASVKTQFSQKITKITCNNRCFDLENGTSVPYGYIRNFVH